MKLRRPRPIVLVSIALSLVLLGPAQAAPGDLDASFGGGGKVVTRLSPGWDGAYAVALQGDGKILAAGEIAGKGSRFALARYTPEGQLDPTFGRKGRVFTNFTPDYDAAWGIAIQPDGRIVVAGDAGLGTDNSMFAVARYKPNGKLDRTFGGDGRVTTQLTKGDDLVAAMVIQPNGRIVVAGGADFRPTKGKVALVRYKPNGKLDRSFSGDGKATTKAARGANYANALAIQPDGKLVAGGFSNTTRRTGRFSLFRFLPNGRLDASFDGDGKVLTDLPGKSGSVQGLAVQPDGAIVAAGLMGTGDPDPGIALARYTPNGALDPIFGAGGVVTSQPTPRLDEAWAVALQADGKILVLGHAGGAGGGFALGRFEASGAPDPTFGAGGWAVTNFTGRADVGWDLAIQPDGRIVAVGAARIDTRKSDFALVRYLPT